MSADLEVEPIPGLPQELPAGERILWQGRPEWRALARETFKVKWLSAYFALFIGLRFAVAFMERQTLSLVVFVPVGLAVLCLALLHALAWYSARTTVYTVTSRRVVMRFGIALPTSWNLPFRRIASADLKLRSDGDGDVVLELTAPNRIAWLHLWPHTQPWNVTRARPTFRAIPEPARVAGILADAVRAWAATDASPVLVATEATFAPTSGHAAPAYAQHAIDGVAARVSP
jgi:hypothetical protein